MADSYISNHRMKNIPAVTLMPGDYVVVAKGYNMNELNGNSYGGTPFISGDIGGGAITYTGVGLYGSVDSGFAYPLNPDSGPANRYLAGTFTYLTAMEADNATHQAYIATTTMGNQNFGGELGMEFKVNAVNGITISQLGAFDHEGNGIIGTQSGGVRVAIFNKATKSIIPGLDAIIVGNADSYISNHRMKNIPAVTLMPGDYVVVAKGYNMNELNGNSYGGTPFISGDMGGGAITYTGVGLYGSEDAGFAYPLNPDSGPANRYLAGTFTYSIVSSNTSTNNVVSVTAKDIHGNTAYATATVTLICEPTSKTNAQTSTDPQSEKRSLQVASSGTILVDKEENTLKVFPNPTAGQFSVQIPPLKVDQAVMQVLNESGKIISQRVVKRFNSTDITSKVDFDLTKQASGVYVVKLISAVGVLVSKEIILR